MTYSARILKLLLLFSMCVYNAPVAITFQRVGARLNKYTSPRWQMCKHWRVLSLSLSRSPPARSPYNPFRESETHRHRNRSCRHRQAPLSKWAKVVEIITHTRHMWKPSWQTWCTPTKPTSPVHQVAIYAVFVCMLLRQSLRCACFPDALITSREERWERLCAPHNKHTSADMDQGWEFYSVNLIFFLANLYF